MNANTYRFGGHRMNRLPRACSSCARNDHKVIVRHADGSREGFCPSCWIGTHGGTAARTRLAGSGATILTDMRRRRPEWDAQRADSAKALRDNIARLSALAATDPMVDRKLIESNRRMLAAIEQEIV